MNQNNQQESSWNTPVDTNLVRNKDHWKVRGLELRHDPQHICGDGTEESSIFTHAVQLQNAWEDCSQALCMLHELQHLLFDGGDEKKKERNEKNEAIHGKKLDTFSLPSSGISQEKAWHL